MRRSQHRPLDFVTAAARPAQNPAEETAGRMQCAGRHARGGGLEFAHKAVSATIAKEFELEAFVCGMVSVVPCELDKCHRWI